jgi:hypothetical protein
MREGSFHPRQDSLCKQPVGGRNQARRLRALTVPAHLSKAPDVGHHVGDLLVRETPRGKSVRILLMPDPVSDAFEQLLVGFLLHVIGPKSAAFSFWPA